MIIIAWIRAGLGPNIHVYIYTQYDTFHLPQKPLEFANLSNLGSARSLISFTSVGRPHIIRCIHIHPSLGMKPYCSPVCEIPRRASRVEDCLEHFHHLQDRYHQFHSTAKMQCDIWNSQTLYTPDLISYLDAGLLLEFVSDHLHLHLLLHLPLPRSHEVLLHLLLLFITPYRRVLLDHLL